MTTLNNSVFGTGTAGSPLSQQMQGQIQGAIGYIGSGVGYPIPPGIYGGMPPSFNVANLLPTAQSSPHPGQPCIGGQSGINPAAGVNAELIQFLSTKFDEVHKRLGKLDLLEKRVEDIDTKVTKIWDD